MRLAKYLKQLATAAATSGTPELNTGHQRWREKVHLGVALVAGTGGDHGDAEVKSYRMVSPAAGCMWFLVLSLLR